MARGTGTRPRRPAPPPPPANPRRSRRFIGVGLAAALIAGAAGMVFLTRGASEVTVEDAVNSYRAQPAEQAADAAAKPAAATPGAAKQAAAPRTAAVAPGRGRTPG